MTGSVGPVSNQGSSLSPWSGTAWMNQPMKYNGPNAPVSRGNTSPYGLGSRPAVDPNASQQGGFYYAGQNPLPQYNDLYQYVNPNAFQPQQDQGIYNTIQQGFGRANQNAPQAQNTLAGQAAQSKGANIGPMQMMNGSNINTSVSNQYQNGQSQLVNMLNAQAQGQGPNLAGIQAQQASQQNVLQQMGVLASQNGSSNPALAQRAAQDQAAQAGQQVAQTAAQTEIQQQLNAQQQLGGALTSGNQLAQQSALNQAQMNQQAGLANQNAYNTAALQQAGMTQNNQQYNASAINAQQQLQANMNQQTSMGNLSASTAQNQLNDQQYNSMLQAYMGQSQQDTQNAVAYQQAMQQAEQANMSLQAGQSVASMQGSYGLAGSAMSGGAGMLAMAAMSDRMVKTVIRSGNRPVRDFLNALGAIYA